MYTPTLAALLVTFVACLTFSSVFVLEARGLRAKRRATIDIILGSSLIAFTAASGVAAITFPVLTYITVPVAFVLMIIGLCHK